MTDWKPSSIRGFFDKEIAKMYKKILEELKKANNYISGEELGEKLGVSRTAIWKGIKK